MVMTTDRKYINDSIIKTYNGSSVSVMKKVVEKYFEIKDKNGDTFQVSNTNDSMKWHQCNTSPRDFVDMLWLYSYAGGQTLIIPAITAGTYESSTKAGTFRLIDLSNQKNITTLTTDRSNKKDANGNTPIVITANLGYKGFSGKHNNVIGNCTDNSFNIQQSNITCEPIKPAKPNFKGEFNEENIKTNCTSPVILSDNVHNNFSKAWTTNVTRLSKFGTNSKRVQVADYDIEAKVLKNIVIGDIVSLNVPYVGMTAQSDIESGFYVVAETVQRIQTDAATKSYTKELVLRRDANLVMETPALLGKK